MKVKSFIKSFVEFETEVIIYCGSRLLEKFYYQPDRTVSKKNEDLKVITITVKEGALIIYV